MNAVTTTKRNQCVDAINAGDANDIQMIPKTLNEKKKNKCNFKINFITLPINSMQLYCRHHEVAMIQLNSN